MATVVPLNLSQIASKINRVISLYPPVPVFQPYFNSNGAPTFPTSSEYTRDESIISFGFPHSIDGPIVGAVDGPGVFSLPPNAYAIVPPSFLSGNPPSINDTYTVLLIDTDATPIEPGISALRVDYLNSNGIAVVDYLDMKFYPKWDLHPRELEEIASYEKNAVEFLQAEIQQINNRLFDPLNRMLIKGLSASGTVAATQATTGLQPSLQAHSMTFIPMSEELDVKFVEYKKVEAQAFDELLSKDAITGYDIVSYPTYVTAGQTFSVVVSGGTPTATEDIYISGYPLGATVNGQTLTATLPKTFNYSYSFNFYVGNKGFIKTSQYLLNVIGNPYITVLTTPISNNYAVIGDTVTVGGANFGLETGTITFSNGASALITNWSQNYVTFIVPTGVISGYSILTTAIGQTTYFTLNIARTDETDTFEITPVSTIIQATETQQFTALFNSNPVTGVNWSIIDSLGNVGQGTLAHGTVDSNGLYTAPASANDVFNIAIAADYVSPNGIAFAKTSVTVIPPPGNLTIVPNTVTVNPFQTQVFEVYNSGTIVYNVQYYVNGIAGGNTTVGTVDLHGLYQAPTGIPNNQSVNVEAIYSSDGVNFDSAIAQVRIVPNTSATGVVSHNVDLLSKAVETVNPAWRTAAFSAGTGKLSLTQPSGAPESMNSLSYTNDYVAAAVGGDVYWAEAYDTKAAKRCIVVVLTSEWTGGGDTAPNAYGFYFVFSSSSNIVGTQKQAGVLIVNQGTHFSATPTQLTSAPVFPSGSDVGYYATTNQNNSGYYFAYNPAVIEVYNNTDLIQTVIPEPNFFSSLPPWMPTSDIVYDNVTIKGDTTNNNSNSSTSYNTMRFVFYPLDSLNNISLQIEGATVNYSGFAGNSITGTIGSLALVPATPAPTPTPSPSPTPSPTPAPVVAPKTPSPTISSVTQACPGQAVTVSGTNFPSDSRVRLVSNGTVFTNNGNPVNVDGVNYTLSVIIPISISKSPASYAIQLYSLSNSSLVSNTNINLVIPSTCLPPPKLTVTPLSSTVNIGSSLQLTATLTEPLGNQSDVTNSALWYIQNIYGGNSIYGLIDNTGYYESPDNVPSINPVLAQATYTYQSTPLTAAASINIVNNAARITPVYQSPTVHQGSYMLRVSPESITIDVPSNGQQFVAELYIDDVLIGPVQASSWSIDDTSFGTIDSSGFYNPPPFYPPPYSNDFKVVANYTALPPAPDSPLPLQGYAVVTLEQVQPQSGPCLVTMATQINIFFGDGRHGYIPAGTEVAMTPGQYLLATYNQTLGTNFTPVNVGGSQSVPLTTAAVQANYLTTSIYNEGQNELVQTAGSFGPGAIIGDPNDLYSMPYTIVLGVCDPVNGLFKSMWDFIKVVYAPNVYIAPQPDTSTLAHELPSSFSDFIGQKFLGAKKVELSSNIKRIQTMWTGSLEYNGKQIKIKSPLNLIKCNTETNKYEIAFTSKTKSVKVQPNSILYYNGSEIVSKPLNDVIDSNSNTFVLGVILDKFYSAWSFLTVVNLSVDYNIDKPNHSYIKINDVFIQWGRIENKKGTINLEIPFKKSYKVQGEASLNITNTTLNSFDYVSNVKDTNWVAIGS
jgi:hypothetical protein